MGLEAVGWVAGALSEPRPSRNGTGFAGRVRRVRGQIYKSVPNPWCAIRAREFPSSQSKPLTPAQSIMTRILPTYTRHKAGADFFPPASRLAVTPKMR
jgi:hypothetical protein